MAAVRKKKIAIDHRAVFSTALQRTVKVDLFYPAAEENKVPMGLLLLNDGQEATSLQLERTMNKLITGKIIPGIMVAAIHADKNRMDEYGVAHSADYRGRGSKAKLYAHFITHELIPWLKHHYFISDEKHAIAGFSLGALSAFDIAWNFPGHFSTAGVFSGSLWWRSKSYKDGYTDDDRIAHAMVKSGSRSLKLKAWFQCGTLDEKEDRNKNGIIDSIDDTVDMIRILNSKGYTSEHLEYVEVQRGRHDFKTWAKVFPDFLKWTFCSERVG